jgi:hypothetical protein
MNKVIRLLLLLGITLSCAKQEIVPPSPPVLQSVEVDGTAFTLPPKGTVKIPFRVKEAEAVFQYVVSQPDCEIVLQLAGGGTPARYELTGVGKEEEKGRYTAVIAEKGTTAQAYSEEVKLVVRGISSGIFKLNKEAEEIPQPAWEQTGLPVVTVTTEGGQGVYSKTEYVTATLQLGGKGLTPIQADCSIRGRGNTTWMWPKKPYLIKLEKKESLLGMPKHKRWILLANFMDKTLMRNLVAMKVSSLTGLDWTPRCESVELVLNGKHLGNYLLIEQVRVDKNRVPVTEMTPEDNDGEAVTGGYLLELDFHYDNEVQWTDPHGQGHQPGFEAGIPFGVKYPDPEDLTAAQLGYIRQYVYTAAEALYGPDFQDPETGYAAYLDVDSFIDYWIVFEVMGNHELGNPGSVYFHKDRGGLLKAGPCWDFDWGILSYNSSPQARTGLINRQAIWYARLFEDPAFRERLKARYQELLPALQTVPAYMEEVRERLRPSASLNFKMWNPAQDATMNDGRIINGDENMSFEDAVTRLKDIYEERLQVILSSL